MGTAGFEPATSGTQSPNHTKLDYVPCVDRIMIPNFKHEVCMILIASKIS
ncbi:uncharacterized protein METZ01_LOCUS58614 [marine metagenome]|uniref:Uncharacterized protein n=1 Tax=marine metagenome TaxID=408172 RepID=A0A381SP10_9ZZZZ